jgi:hypothetical protein
MESVCDSHCYQKEVSWIWILKYAKPGDSVSDADPLSIGSCGSGSRRKKSEKNARKNKCQMTDNSSFKAVLPEPV